VTVYLKRYLSELFSNFIQKSAPAEAKMLRTVIDATGQLTGPWITLSEVRVQEDPLKV
jgi:hypothetical protein